MPPWNKKPPLVVFALDAGDGHLIRQWTADGSLPHLASIMKQGCWGEISQGDLFSEFGQWMSLLSGKGRAQHGYYYFRQLVPGTYDLRPCSHLDVEVLPFWAYLNGTGLKTAVIDAPECCMVSNLDGFQLSEWAARHLPQRLLPLRANPPELLQEARRVFGRRIKIVDYSPNTSPEQDLKVLKRMLDRVERKGRLSRHLVTKNHYDLIVLGYFEAHDAGHRFWDYHNAWHDEKNSTATELIHAIRLVYRAIDHELGLLLKSLPTETSVAVLSCYGMATSFNTTDLFDSFCHQLGYQSPRLRPSGSGPLDLARRLVPQKWRQSLSNYLPVHIQERVLADHFKNATDWTRTQAFSIPSVHLSFVRVNMRNREPQGCVSWGKDYEMLLDRLETDLAQVSDPVTGQPSVEYVERSALKSGGTPPGRLPDMFVKWKDQPRFCDRLVHPRAELHQNQGWFHRSSSHSPQGFFAASGPSIGIFGQVDNAPLLGFAPTLLRMLRQNVPGELSGELIHPLISGYGR